MGLFRFNNKPEFDGLVEILHSKKYLTLSDSNVISLNKSQETKMSELGFMVFLTLIYTTYYKNIAICTNNDFFRNKTLVLFPRERSRDILGRTFDGEEIFYKLNPQNRLVNAAEIQLLSNNLKAVHPLLKLPRLNAWKEFYDLMMSDIRYSCALGGPAVIVEVPSQLTTILFTGMPTWDNTKMSTLFDSILTVIQAAYYKDTNLYCANTAITAPFKSYELDSVLFKTDGTAFGDVSHPSQIERMVVIETSICSDARQMEATNADYIPKVPNEVELDVKINKKDYLPHGIPPKTSFQNKLITYLSLLSTKTKKFGYIFIALKFGLLDPKFFQHDTTGTTSYGMKHADNFCVIELRINDNEFFKKSPLKSPINVRSIKSVYRKLIEDFKRELRKYK